MKRILILICALVFCTPFWAQNLDKMNEAKRKTALLRIAKEGILEFAPDYYREYGEPEIAHGYVDNVQKFSDDQLKKYRNRSYYTVKYFYDKNEEAFWGDYSACVYIWGDTGKVFRISSSSGMGLGNLDDPEAMANPDRVKRMEWKKQPPGSLHKDRAIKLKEGEIPEGDTPDIPLKWRKKKSE